MSLIRRLLSFIMFAALIPAGMQAQEQKGDIDFNIGISSLTTNHTNVMTTPKWAATDKVR